MVKHKLPWDFPYIHLYPIADAHIGSAEFDEKLFKLWVQTVQGDPYGYAVIAGDMLNNGIKTSKTNVYEEKMRPAQQKEYLYEALNPIKEKILGACGGNHCYRNIRDVDDAAVEAYLEESYDEAKKRGYTRTMMGRIRPLAEVPVSPRDRDGLRRVAVNSPIQGTAADIARKAMVDFGTRYPASGDVRLVLQVHDSLVCECPEDKASETEEALRHLMEQAVQLSVPLRAESKRGKTLADV